MQPVEYIDRRTGEKIAESVMGDKALRFAYETLAGRTLWPVLFGSKFLSALMGRKYDSPKSKKDIVKLASIPGCRAEEQAARLGGRFDIVTSRAVAALDVLTELSMPFLRVGGFFMPMKSCNDASREEVEKAMHAIEFMGGCLREAYEYEIEPGVRRQILRIEKVKPSPKGYPRKYAAIVKKPL